MGARNPEEKVKTSLVTGAGSATLIAVTGMVAEDMVQSVHNLTDLTAVSLSGLAVEAGGFKITASTSAKQLLVHWIDRSAG
jgi:hypothetical protein